MFKGIAAAAGLGLAVVPIVMVEPHLADGRLHLAAGAPVCSGMGYFAAYPEQNARITRVRHFRDWIIAETRSYPRGAHHAAARNPPSEGVAEEGTKTPSSLGTARREDRKRGPSRRSPNPGSAQK